MRPSRLHPPPPIPLNTLRPGAAGAETPALPSAPPPSSGLPPPSGVTGRSALSPFRAPAQSNDFPPPPMRRPPPPSSLTGSGVTTTHSSDPGSSLSPQGSARPFRGSNPSHQLVYPLAGGNTSQTSDNVSPTGLPPSRPPINPQNMQGYLLPPPVTAGDHYNIVRMDQSGQALNLTQMSTQNSQFGRHAQTWGTGMTGAGAGGVLANQGLGPQAVVPGMLVGGAVGAAGPHITNGIQRLYQNFGSQSGPYTALTQRPPVEQPDPASVTVLGGRPADSWGTDNTV